MRLCYFSRSFVRRLADGAAANASRYAVDPAWLYGFASGDKFVHDSSLVVDPPPQLVFEDKDNPRHDAENAIRVYTWLESLTPALAMEERLWACLSHWTFAEYMAAR